MDENLENIRRAADRLEKSAIHDCHHCRYLKDDVFHKYIDYALHIKNLLELYEKSNETSS